MRCLICHTPDDARPRHETSDFAALFAPIIHQLETHWWLIDGGGYSPWKLPPDWYGDDHRMEAFDSQFKRLPGPDDRVLAPSDVFRHCMGYLTDHWIDISAFPCQPKDPEKVHHWQVRGLPQIIGMPAEATHQFINVDGLYWALLTNDLDCLHRMNERWRNSDFRETNTWKEAT